MRVEATLKTTMGFRVGMMSPYGLLSRLSAQWSSSGKAQDRFESHEEVAKDGYDATLPSLPGML